jgi:hypothetical protein
MQTINYEESLSKQLDILLVNEPDTSRNGDKYLDWKNALSEVREQIDALHQDPGWDNVHESSQAERATKQSRRHSINVRTPMPQHQRDHEAVVEAVTGTLPQVPPRVRWGAHRVIYQKIN